MFFGVQCGFVENHRMAVVQPRILLGRDQSMTSSVTDVVFEFRMFLLFIF